MMLGLLLKAPDALRVLLVGGVLGNTVTPDDQVVTAITHATSEQMLWTYLGLSAFQLFFHYVKKWVGGGDDTRPSI